MSAVSALVLPHSRVIIGEIEPAGILVKIDMTGEVKPRVHDADGRFRSIKSRADAIGPDTIAPEQWHAGVMMNGGFANGLDKKHKVIVSQLVQFRALDDGCIGTHEVIIPADRGALFFQVPSKVSVRIVVKQIHEDWDVLVIPGLPLGTRLIAQGMQIRTDALLQSTGTDPFDEVQVCQGIELADGDGCLEMVGMASEQFHIERFDTGSPVRIHAPIQKHETMHDTFVRMSACHD